MASDLDKGAIAGRETYLYYNSGTNASPTFVEITRARNVQVNDGNTLSEVEMHGTAETGNVTGYKKFSGSFEYVKRRGADTVFAALKTHRDNGTPVELRHMDDDNATTGAKGWQAPVYLGEFQETSNGSDGVVVTIPFAKADCFDAGGTAVDVSYPTIS